MATGLPIRVRFAPSPTGFLHIGSARTALFNWLFARHNGGTYILRIDDTDEQRSTEESMREIYDSLKWLGLDWDEGAVVGGPYGPYVQSERGEIYRKYVQKLLDSDDAYYCYCTPQELTEMREKARAEGRSTLYDGRHRNLTETERRKFEAEGRKPVVRIKVPDESIVAADVILGESVTPPANLQDEIILKSNGSPLYNFTTVIDDYEMKVSHVIRGGDHINNTAKQLVIYRALGVEPPQFAHVPLVFDGKGEKLSKRRHGELVSVGKYREDGYLPEAMINYLVRLGWSYDDKQEIFSIDELIEKFEVERIGKSNVVFDVKKLQWLNKHYIMERDLSARTDAVIPFLQRDGLLEANSSPVQREWLEKIVESVGDRMTTLADITTQTGYFFTDDFEYDPKAIKRWWKKGDPLGTLQGIRDVIEKLETFGLEEAEAAIWEYTDKNNVKRVQVMQPLRVALTGQSFGPGLFEIIVLLGKEKTLARLDQAISYMKAGI
ncbi:glutamate--tRNA ligase [Candidatus Poribacteria bacterium]|nr:glutamate--tRNA ligase [Candidatus Poribacteria bacterium]